MVKNDWPVKVTENKMLDKKRVKYRLCRNRNIELNAIVGFSAYFFLDLIVIWVIVQSTCRPSWLEK